MKEKGFRDARMEKPTTPRNREREKEKKASQRKTPKLNIPIFALNRTFQFNLFAALEKKCHRQNVRAEQRRRHQQHSHADIRARLALKQRTAS